MAPNRAAKISRLNSPASAIFFAKDMPQDRSRLPKMKMRWRTSSWTLVKRKSLGSVQDTRIGVERQGLTGR